jgi:hypothetical protein
MKLGEAVVGLDGLVVVASGSGSGSLPMQPLGGLGWWFSIQRGFAGLGGKFAGGVVGCFGLSGGEGRCCR